MSADSAVPKLANSHRIDASSTPVRFLCLLAITTLLLSNWSDDLHAQGSQEDYERSASLWSRTQGKVFQDRVDPIWIDGMEAFHYRSQLSADSWNFRLVDCERGTQTDAFDHTALAKALAEKLQRDINATQLPIEQWKLSPTEKQLRFNLEGKGWLWNLETATLSESEKVAERERPQRRRGRGRFRGDGRPSAQGNKSPDQQWEVRSENHNLVLVHLADDKKTTLTTDGVEGDYYEPSVFWSPDSSKFVALRIEPGEPHPVFIVESSPKDQVQPKLRQFDYQKPGDRLTKTKPYLFHAATGKPIKISEDLFPNPWSIEMIRWQPDSSRFTFLYNQRGHQVVRILSVDGESGECRTLIDESSQTFVDYAHKLFTHFNDEAGEVLWLSERSGWNHLYRIDSKTGDVKNAITSGNWVVRGVDRVDNEQQKIWFRASGIHPDQDPYYIHYCRVNFDGTELVVLTEGDGTHEANYSPSQRYFIDSYSRVDAAPICELRDAQTGKKILELTRGDLSQLKDSGWQSPERFVAKGRDGTTDIYGVIYRPTNFDSGKSYPIVESIYAGPHDSHVPKSFSQFHYEQEMAELGFIVVQIDGMGTSNRSKAFHDVCWKNLGDSGFPDRRLWIEAAAKQYPYMDLKHIGIYGGSAGGQSAMRALLAHGDFYHVAVADCGCHDNRMDKIWWNELWMSYPIGPHYEEQSNVTQAHRLTGKLLLVVGELDDNVDPASTMQVVNALIKADKDFDFLIIPGGGHGSAESPYGRRKRKDFLVRHLLGVEPRN